MNSINKIPGFLFFLMLTVTTARGQQDPLSTQYMFNPMAVNPSYIASADVVSFTSIFRNQWAGFEGAPKTQFLSGTFPVKKLNFTLGGTLVHDVVGPVKQTALYLDYGYAVRINEKSRINFGLRGGLGFYRADIGELSTVSEFDPLFESDIQKRTTINFGLGACYTNSRFYAGYSIPKLINNKFDKEEGTAVYVRHHYIFGGAKFILSPDFDLYPTLMSKLVQGASPSVDISASALYRKKIGAGLTYRIGASIGVMLSYEVYDNLRVGYSYDMATTEMHYQSGGTHELMITYSIGKGANTLDRQFVMPSQ